MTVYEYENKNPCMFFVNCNARQIEFWDSMSCLDDAYKVLEEQLLRRLKGWGITVDTEWTISKQENIPKQLDHFNCGVMLLLYAESIVGETSLDGLVQSRTYLTGVWNKIWYVVSGEDASKTFRQCCAHVDDEVVIRKSLIYH
jgi:Ulp1 family protease